MWPVSSPPHTTTTTSNNFSLALIPGEFHGFKKDTLNSARAQMKTISEHGWLVMYGWGVGGRGTGGHSHILIHVFIVACAFHIHYMNQLLTSRQSSEVSGTEPWFISIKYCLISIFFPLCININFLFHMFLLNSHRFWGQLQYL